jgi:uncharacterized membrane protein
MHPVFLYFILPSIPVAAFVAKAKGRSIFGWCFLALLIGWIAVLLLFLMTNLLEEARKLALLEQRVLDNTRRAERAQQTADGRAAMAELDAEVSRVALSQLTDTRQADTRDCPYCAETIKAAAKVCRFCNRDVEPLANAQ